MAKFHSFAEMTQLAGKQTAAEAFGAKSDAEFRLTGSFIITADVKAFAAISGKILLQPVNTTEDPGAELVNLIIKPTMETEVGFSKVMYFIYRGLKKADFLDSSDKVLTTGSEFITRINQEQTDRRVSQPTLGEIPKSSLFGTPNPPQTSTLEALFFATNAGGSNTVTIGEYIGNFKSGKEIGFEIILENPVHHPTVEEAQKLVNKITDAAGAGIDKRSKRERVIHYVDPSAYYGLHCNAKKFVGNKTSATVKYNPQDDDLTTQQAIFDIIMKVFNTKNRVYVDIRNDNGYSLNYYNNYLGESPDTTKEIRKGINTTTLTTDEYYNKSGWPFYVIDDPVNTTTNENIILLNLPINDNKKPIIYVESGKVNSATNINNFIDESILLGASTSWTNNIEFRNLNIPASTNPSKSVSTVIRLYYIRQVNLLTTSPSTSVVTHTHAHNVFGPLKATVPWISADATKWNSTSYKKYIDGNNEALLHFDVETAIAFMDSPTKRVMVAGDITSSMHDKKIRIINSNSAGNYTVKEIAFGSGVTTITVEEELAGGNPLGSVRFTKTSTCFVDPPAKKLTVIGYDLSTEPGLAAGKNIRLKFFGGKEVKNIVQSISVLIIGTIINLTKDLDKGGFGYLAQSGIAIQNNRVVFYALPVTYYKTGKRKRSVARMLAGGRDKSESFRQVLQKYLPDYEMARVELSPHGASSTVPVITNPADQGIKESLFAMGLRQEEYDSIKALADSSLSSYHIVFLNPRRTSNVLSDKYLQVYATYELDLVGYDSSGNGTPVSTGITIYSKDDILFTSPAFAAVSMVSAPGLTIHETPEERTRNTTGNTALYQLSPAMVTLVANFKTSLDSLPPNDLAAVRALILQKGAEVLTLGRNLVKMPGATLHKDGILYYARLHMSVALKNCPALIFKPESERKIYVDLLERVTRGMEGSAAANFVPFGTSRIPILISGFDPFQGRDTNPSGSLVLSLHGEEIVSADTLKTGVIQSAIFPVRFKDFEEEMVENFFKQFIDPADFGANPYIIPAHPVRMIITFSQGTEVGDFEIERHAARVREKTGDDNNGEFGESASLSTRTFNPPTPEFILNQLPHDEFITPPAAGELVNDDKFTLDQKLQYQIKHISNNDSTGDDRNVISFLPKIIKYYRNDSVSHATINLPLSPREPGNLAPDAPDTVTATVLTTAGGVNGKYDYKVTALNGFTETAGTNSDVIDTAGQDKMVKITWNEVWDAVAYRVYRRRFSATVPNPNPFLLLSDTLDPSYLEYTDFGMTPGTPVHSPSTTPVPLGASVDAIKGGGGFFLSNEIAYRVSLLRFYYNHDLKSGHIHNDFLDFDTRDNMLTIIKAAISRALNNL